MLGPRRLELYKEKNKWTIAVKNAAIVHFYFGGKGG